MDLHAILVRAPVNRLAASVVSQRRAAATDAPLQRAELIYLMDRLARKQRLLKLVLGIKNKRQHKNMKWKANKRIPQYRVANEPRAAAEYCLLGVQMQRLNIELAAQSAARKELRKRREPPNR